MQDLELVPDARNKLFETLFQNGLNWFFKFFFPEYLH